MNTFEIKYKPSIYNHFIPLKNNRKLAYNALSASLAIMEENEFKFYSEIEENSFHNPLDEIFANLIKGKYIVNSEIDERFELEKEYRMQRFADDTMVLTISPTLQCNLKCDYCFQGGDKIQGSMSVEVQTKIVDYVQSQIKYIKHLHIAWYGGEPLLQLEIIKNLSTKLIELCNRNRKQYSAMMVTNAYLLTPDTIESLQNLGVQQMQITFDGPEQVHDSIRKQHSGAPTFRRIVENMQAVVDKTKILFSVRVNVDIRNYQSIFQLIDSLVDAGLNNKKNFQLYFAPIEAITESCHCIADKSLSKAQYATIEAKLLYYASRAGLAHINLPSRFKGSCAASRVKGFVINPDGDMHKCWDTVMYPERKVGTVFNTQNLYNDKIYCSWLDWNPFKNEICRNCKIIANCAGACAYKFLYSEDTKGEAGVLPCVSWRYNLNERLIQIAVNTKIILVDDFIPEEVRTIASDLVIDNKEQGQPIPLTISEKYKTIDK